MCGRSSLHDAPVNVLERFRLPPALPGFRPRYNIAPSQDQWTIALDEAGAPELKARRWGLIPYWANDPAIGNRMINARADSLSDKPAFRDAFRDRRCIVPADGYYEWMGSGKSKVPLFFHMAGHTPFAMAGLWEGWEKGGSRTESCAIITTDASSRTSRYHHRMPALLTLDAAEEWLDASTRPSRALDLLEPYEGNDLECYEVSRYVNTPANDSPECMAPVEPFTVSPLLQPRG